MQTLERLLSPHTPADFASQYWGHKMLHVAGVSSKFDDVFNWSMLNNLLAHHIHYIPSAQLALSKDGIRISPQAYREEPQSRKNRRLSPGKISKQVQDGATLIINGAQTLSPTLRHLSRDLQTQLNERNQINLYVSQSAQKGFNTHFDTHEVMVLQIEGSKRWEIYSERPNQHPKAAGHDRLARHPSTPQYLTLVKGDLLYVPRGMYHSAQALSGPSLHITIGIPCRTHIDFAHWMIDQLAHLPEMRKNLPRHWLESSMEYRDSDLQDHAIKILDALREMIEAGDLGSRFDKEVSARKAPVSSMRFPL